MDARRAALRVPVDEVIRSFLDHCEERPLYLRPLVEYYSQPEANSGAAPDRADLLRYLIDRAVDDNPDPALVGGERQAPWTALRDLAESLIDELTFGVERLEEAAGRALGVNAAREQFRAFSGCLKRFLIEEDGEFRFFHDDYRGFLLADALRNRLCAGMTGRFDHRQVLDLSGEMIFSLAHSNERRQLAVGTHSGRVRLYEFADQASLPTPMGDFVLPCGDIVRSLFFLDGGNALLVVS